MDLGVRGKAYILVGGTRGMGWEAARVLAGDGANLALIARDRRLLARRVAELADSHGIRAIGLGADSSRPGEVEAAIAEAIAAFGTVRGMLVTTGMTNNNGTLLEMSEEQWQANFDDVMMGTVRPCKAIVPHLIANGGGTIVTSAAYSVRDAKSFLFGYASLKSAIVNFTKNMAKVYGPQGVRANCVCPGAVATGRVQERIEATMKDLNLPWEEAQWEVMSKQFNMPVALRRPGLAEELGDVMAFLLSERGAYTTGAVVNVDGGTNF